MIKQSLTFNDILEKKFRILRTSIILGNLRNRDETLSEYEDTAKEIDKIKTSVYEELLSGKIYTTITLEEEETRLKELISFIEDRIKERNDFVDDYIKITSNFLDGLDKISLEDELNSYRLRYDNIREYLNNCKEINDLNDKLRELRNELEQKYENKANNELINSKLEEELIEEFNKFISRNSYYSELNYTDLDSELIKVEESLEEKKGVLDTFTSSYDALINAGISGAEREEYSSYVMDAKLSYYEDIEKKCVLDIYRLILDKQVDYDRLYEKRYNIDSILENRDKVKEELNIKKIRDDLEYFVSLSKEQFSIIRTQKINIDNIDKLILEISSCESKLELLDEANNRTEIVELLNEFSLENVKIEKIDMPEEKHFYEDIIEDNSDKPANMVVNVKDAIDMDVEKASDTAKLVMKKVVMVLEPKRFNQKNNKVENNTSDTDDNNKELEDVVKGDLTEEIEDNLNEEEKEEIIEVEDDVTESDNNITIENIDDDNTEDFVIDDILSSNDIFEDELFNDDGIEEVTNTITDVNDIFLDDVPNETNKEVNIEINTKDVAEEDDIFKDLFEDEMNEVEESKSEEKLIPAEMFFGEPTVNKDKDLFKVTDPFLDDNEFELGVSNKNDAANGFMPNLGSIGTVKPNNALSKIEDVVKETDDIVLPSLGLVDDTKTDIPIVSENYIN